MASGRISAARGMWRGPSGSGLTDFQGVVRGAGVQLDPWQLLRACELAAWNFDHLLATQSEFIPYHWTAVDSPYVDLAGGFAAYLAGRRESGEAAVLQAQSKQAKAGRQLGPVRFQWETADRGVLARLIEWKSAQYAATQVTSPFSFAWTGALLDRLFDLPAGGDLRRSCRRCTSATGWRRPTLACGPVGSCTGGSRPTTPSWANIRRAQLLLELLRRSAERGFGRLDLGKGPEIYKQDFMTGTRALAEGSVDSRLVSRTVRRTWHQAHHWVRDSRLRGPMLVPWRLIRHVRDELIFR